jgi:hypothetical protein
VVQVHPDAGFKPWIRCLRTFAVLARLQTCTVGTTPRVHRGRTVEVVAVQHRQPRASIDGSMQQLQLPPCARPAPAAPPQDGQLPSRGVMAPRVGPRQALASASNDTGRQTRPPTTHGARTHSRAPTRSRLTAPAPVRSRAQTGRTWLPCHLRCQQTLLLGQLMQSTTPWPTLDGGFAEYHPRV